MLLLLLLFQVKGCNEASVTVKQSREKIMKENSLTWRPKETFSLIKTNTEKEKTEGIMRRVSLLFSFIISSLFLQELKRTSFLSAEACLSIPFVSLAFDENTFHYFLHKTITTEIVEEAKRVRSCCWTDGHDMNVSSFISLLVMMMPSFSLYSFCDVHSYLSDVVSVMSFSTSHLQWEEGRGKETERNEKEW